MCGIAGIWDLENQTSEKFLAKEVINMANSIKTRGPDSYGYWVDSQKGISLSHRRLAIQDLSNNGNQPFLSFSGRYVLVFNGEIYNHYLLREELEKTKSNKRLWKSSSDTETLLECIETWGLNKSLEKFSGMFAFALWDKKTSTLSLVRDRFGEKPLYYGFKKIFDKKKAFIFSSDLKALRALSGYEIIINKNALVSYFNQGYISAPQSIEEGISQLMPGNYLEINLKKFEYQSSFNCSPVRWWDPLKVSRNSCQFNKNEKNFVIDELNKTLLESVEQKKISDVPLGVFLSGGIDSSLICALSMHNSNKPINSFTVTFPDTKSEEKSFNEGPYAKMIASYLGTNHNEIQLSSKDLLRLIPSISSIFSEPFADSSQIPTHLICREAFNREIKVALSGDGADELFGGYNRHTIIPEIHKIFKHIPFQIRVLFSEFLLSLPKSKRGLYQQRIQKLSKSLLYADDPAKIYKSLISEFKNISSILKKEYLLDEYINEVNLPNAYSLSESIMLADLNNYLHSDILTKTDRSSMATSLEVRAPFLDHRLAKLAWRIPLSMKIKNRQNKWILRELLSNYLPANLYSRPKSGFAIPINHWLRGPLRDWANDLLAVSKIKSQGYLNAEFVKEMWDAHLNGSKDNSSKLWTILIWQSWLSDMNL